LEVAESGDLFLAEFAIFNPPASLLREMIEVNALIGFGAEHNEPWETSLMFAREELGEKGAGEFGNFLLSSFSLQTDLGT